MRRLIFALMLATVPLLAEDFTFEVASVKPTGSAAKGSSIWTNETGFRTENTPLNFLIQFAYNAQDYQIIGAPSWVKDDGWDINAKNEVAEVDKLLLQDRKSVEARTERMRSRVRHMLQDRFQLKVRQEEKELPVYALTVDKTGLKIEAIKEPKGNMRSNRSNAAGTIHGEGIALDRLSQTLGNILERPVVDETGLDGFYDIDLKYSLDTSAPGNDAAPSEDVTGPSIFTALREQLGLRLAGKKGPVTTWVVEKVEKPGEN